MSEEGPGWGPRHQLGNETRVPDSPPQVKVKKDEVAFFWIKTDV